MIQTKTSEKQADRNRQPADKRVTTFICAEQHSSQDKLTFHFTPGATRWAGEAPPLVGGGVLGLHALLLQPRRRKDLKNCVIDSRLQLEITGASGPLCQSTPGKAR